MKFKSKAQWPAIVAACHGTSITTGEHETYEEARATCDRLERDGLGGDAKIFPISTWVEECDDNADGDARREQPKRMNTSGTTDQPIPAVTSSAWLGALPACDGWYAAYYPPQAHEAIVRVRYDGERGERVVDVVGQPLKQSEELWRYKEWMWSERLTLTAPND